MRERVTNILVLDRNERGTRGAVDHLRADDHFTHAEDGVRPRFRDAGANAARLVRGAMGRRGLGSTRTTFRASNGRIISTGIAACFRCRSRTAPTSLRSHQRASSFRSRPRTTARSWRARSFSPPDWTAAAGGVCRNSFPKVCRGIGMLIAQRTSTSRHCAASASASSETAHRPSTMRRRRWRRMPIASTFVCASLYFRG